VFAVLPLALAALLAHPGASTDPLSGYPRRDPSEHHEALGPVWLVKDSRGVAREVIYENGRRLRADGQAPALISGAAELPDNPGIAPDEFPLIVFRSYFPPEVMRRCRDGELACAT
jgi:hypothetical protein